MQKSGNAPARPVEVHFRRFAIPASLLRGFAERPLCLAQFVLEGR